MITRQHAPVVSIQLTRMYKIAHRIGDHLLLVPQHQGPSQIIRRYAENHAYYDRHDSASDRVVRINGPGACPCAAILQSCRSILIIGMSNTELTYGVSSEYKLIVPMGEIMNALLTEANEHRRRHNTDR